MLMNMSSSQPGEDVPAWLENFAETYVNSGNPLQEGFLNRKLFNPPITGVYLREISRDGLDGTGPTGWVQFEATVRGGEVFTTERVITD
jgi:hypothetical protein